MVYCDGSSEEWNIAEALVGAVQAHEVSQENKNSAGNWARGHSCCKLPKSLAVFCSCSKSLNEAEFKSDRH